MHEYTKGHALVIWSDETYYARHPHQRPATLHPGAMPTGDARVHPEDRATWAGESVTFDAATEGLLTHIKEHTPLTPESTCKHCQAAGWTTDPIEELKRCKKALEHAQQCERQKRLRIVEFSRKRLTRRAAALQTFEQIVIDLQAAAREGDAAVTRLQNTVKTLEGFLNAAREESALLREGVAITRTFLDTWTEPMNRNHEQRFVEVSAKFHELQRINAEREQENAALRSKIHILEHDVEKLKKDKARLEERLLTPLKGGKAEEKKQA